MVFSSLSFLFLFLPLLYLLLFLSRSPRWRNGVLILASLVFYGWGEPLWILAMLFSTAVNYVCARLIDATERPGLRRLLLTVGVIASVAFLFYFKYAAFLLNTFLSIFGAAWRMPAPRLPIGISFYTFQILTYTVDVYRRKAPVLRNPFRLLLYISCFPQLIAGPIVQYGDVADQLAERSITPGDFSLGMHRFIKGLAKKVLLANLCGAVLEELPAAGAGPMSVGGAWLAALMFSLQLYFDFSAYSDMAIGLGRTLGFRYKENFRFPFCSRSVAEYWSRWHISLTGFFREYIYFPLGGSRCGTARTLRNMAVVWALTGFWHGADWNFVLWGIYSGMTVMLERFVFARPLKHVPGVFRWALTFGTTLIGMTMFYNTDLSCLAQHIGALFGLGAVGWMDAASLNVLRKYSLFPLLALVLSMPWLPILAGKLPQPLLRVLRPLCSAVLFVSSVLFLVGQSYNPFIYFRF